MRLIGRKNKSESRKLDRPSNTRPATFSYYARGASSNDSNTSQRGSASSDKSRRYRLKFSHVPSYIALVAITVALGYACLLNPNPKVIIVNAPDTVSRDAKVYKDAVSSIWGKSIFSRTKLTVSTNGIQREIAQMFPELANIRIELPLLGRTATVVLTPVKPALQFVSLNGSFYVDSDGKVLAKTSELKQNDIKDLPFIRDESGISSDPGKNIIPGPDAKFLQNLYANLRAQDVAVESITLPAGVAMQADVRVPAQQYYIKFSLDSDPRQAVGTYLATKAKLDSGGVVPAEYLDVRLAEKVFYK